MNFRSSSWTRTISQVGACYMTTVTVEYARTMTKRYTHLGYILQQSVKRILILQGIKYNLKIIDGSYLRRHWQGHQSVEDGCRIQAQAHADRELVLPLQEVLAKCLGHGRRGTLERIYIGSPVVDPSMQGTKPVISQPC
jgi:hypothetical protein